MTIQADRKPQTQPSVSEREREVLGLVAQGLTNADIGNRLYISPNTVKTHLLHLSRRLGANNRRALTARALELGIIK